MDKDRIRMLMTVTFKYKDDNEEHEESVWIPYPIFMDAIRKYFESNMVTLDGTDTAIWNMLVELDCLDFLEDNETVMEYCRELYKGSVYEEEDYEAWVDEYEMLHDLGEYAPKVDED